MGQFNMSNKGRHDIREQKKMEDQARRLLLEAQRNTQRYCNHRDERSGELSVRPIGSDLVRCTQCNVEFAATQYDDAILNGSVQVLQNSIQFIRAMTVSTSEKDEMILAQLSDLSNDIGEIPRAYRSTITEFENRNLQGGGRRRGRSNDVYGDRIADLSPRRWR